jgi:hypothetical protein
MHSVGEGGQEADRLTSGFRATAEVEADVAKVVLAAYFPGLVEAPNTYRLRAASSAALISTFVAFLVAVTLNSADRYIPSFARWVGVVATAVLLFSVMVALVAALRPHPGGSSKRWIARVNDVLCRAPHGPQMEQPAIEDLVDYAAGVLIRSQAETRRLRRLTSTAAGSSVLGIGLATIAAVVALLSSEPNRQADVILTSAGAGVIDDICGYVPTKPLRAEWLTGAAGRQVIRLTRLDGSCQDQTVELAEDLILATVAED